MMFFAEKLSFAVFEYGFSDLLIQKLPIAG